MINSYVIGFRLTNGQIQPIAWSDRKLSHKMLRSAMSKFRNDADFVKPYQDEWSRLYDSPQEMKKQLPRY